MTFTVAKFKDVADGTQAGQFTVGDREKAASLSDLAPIYRQLLDEPVTAIIAVMGATGRPNLTPVRIVFATQRECGRQIRRGRYG